MGAHAQGSALAQRGRADCLGASEVSLPSRRRRRGGALRARPLRARAGPPAPPAPLNCAAVWPPLAQQRRTWPWVRWWARRARCGVGTPARVQSPARQWSAPGRGPMPRSCCCRRKLPVATAHCRLAQMGLCPRGDAASPAAPMCRRSGAPSVWRRPQHRPPAHPAPAGTAACRPRPAGTPAVHH